MSTIQAEQVRRPAHLNLQEVEFDRALRISAVDEALPDRLKELGFIEGAKLQVKRHGPFGSSPIWVRLGDSDWAIHDREARLIYVTAQDGMPLQGRFGWRRLLSGLFQKRSLN